MFKLKKALNKTKFDDKLIKDHELEKGHPSAILKIIHHLIFKASESFTNHIIDSL